MPHSNDRAFLTAIAHYHPQTVLDNAFFERTLQSHGGTSAAWIEDRVGIRERRFMSDYRGPWPVFEIGKRAVERLITQGVDLSQIDLILSCSSTDDLQYPGAANLISEHFGLHVPAFHLKNGCSTVLFAIETARGFLKLGYRNILLVNGEPFTTQVDYSDRKACILFGDASSALVVSSDPQSFKRTEPSALLEISGLRLGGRGSRVITSSAPGATPSRSVFDAYAAETGAQSLAESPRHGGCFKQEGKEVFDWVVRTMPDMIHSFLKDHGRSLETLSYFIGHQSNLSMLNDVCERLRLPKSKHLCNIDRYGNTSSAGWVTVLSEHLRSGTIRAGEEILVSVFGAGLAWANLLLKRI